MKRISIAGIILILSLTVTNFVGAQCPMCKTALTSSRKNEKKIVGNGINKGILFLLSTPYILVGTAGLVWYKANQKKKKNTNVRIRI